jgi:hypothetical protein
VAGCGSQRSIHELACGRRLAERELGLGEGDERIG